MPNGAGEYCAWITSNVELLRNGHLSEVDAEHIAEELESMAYLDLPRDSSVSRLLFRSICMNQPALHETVTVENYPTGEDASDIRHEYMGGRVYAITGASRSHGLITLNIATFLRPLVRGTGCQLFANDVKVRLSIGGDDIFYSLYSQGMRLQVQAADAGKYSDLMALCGDERSRFLDRGHSRVMVSNKS